MGKSLTGARGFLSRTWSEAVALAAIAAAAAACQPDVPKAAGLPECPGDGAHVVIEGERTGPGTPAREIPEVAPISDIPEFHDCQQFILDDTTYGARYAVFAISRLALVADSLVLDQQSPPATRVAHLVGVVYSWGGDYPDLGINNGWNCVYMWSVGDTLSSSMLHQGTSNYTCAAKINGPPGANETLLSTHEFPLDSAYTRTDYPGVARWGFDDSTNTQFVSIKCAATWCELGRSSGFQGSTGMNATTAFPPVADFAMMPTVSAAARPRTAEIRGWNDVQRLARMVSGALHPGPVRGILIPHKALGLLDDAAQFDPITGRQYVPVAYAMMSASYSSRLHFDVGLNSISACRGSRADCVPVGATVPTACTIGAWQWWAKMESSTTGDRYTCVKQRLHSGAGMPPIPGTARWRWDKTDETVWFRCMQGCCEMQ